MGTLMRWLNRMTHTRSATCTMQARIADWYAMHSPNSVAHRVDDDHGESALPLLMQHKAIAKPRSAATRLRFAVHHASWCTRFSPLHRTGADAVVVHVFHRIGA
jgi:hypothetical protein